MKGIYGDSVRPEGTPDPQAGDIDLDAVEVLGDWASGLDAERAFKEAIAAKPGLKVLMLTGEPATNACFVSPPTGGGIGLYALECGLDIVEPEGPDPVNLNVLESAIWEELGTYPADLILYDSRPDPAIVFPDDAVWLSLPAVQAGQVGIWHSTFPYSYPKLNVVLDEVPARIANAEIVS